MIVAFLKNYFIQLSYFHLLFRLLFFFRPTMSVILVDDLVCDLIIFYKANLILYATTCVALLGLLLEK